MEIDMRSFVLVRLSIHSKLVQQVLGFLISHSYYSIDFSECCKRYYGRVYNNSTFVLAPLSDTMHGLPDYSLA